MTAATASDLHARILLVEDEPGIAQMLAAALSESGFTAVAVGSAAEMDRVLEREPADMVILDVMLPGEDGVSICRRLRSASPVPIIMLTALGEEIDRVVGLEVGADDYVTKPFSSRELVARIRALLRRARAGTQGTDAARPFRFAGWTLDPGRRQLLDPDGAHITLTSAEFDLLQAFCQRPGQVLSREKLLEVTRCGTAGPIERTIDVHVSRIRQKLEADPREPALIKTVRLGGYLFTPTVERP
ncbi:MAG TPA: response regulator transcription factor [Steroidobacteraceae bacterium]|nr:response regulator transcription factor [Steroidobacteraceae bacterium]